MRGIGSKMAASIFCAVVLCGCSAPPASLDLIAVARKGVVSARQAQVAQHDRQVKQLQAQAAAMDAAFDADVKLAESGALKDEQGKPLTLTAQWVISARKGYAAARDMVSESVRQEEGNHATCLDNLDATDEALDMAAQLIVQQMAVGEKLRQELLAAQKKLIK